ncbi:protein CC2D2B-like [Cetorhinus maximus]
MRWGILQASSQAGEKKGNNAIEAPGSPKSHCLETCNLKPHVKHWLGSIAIPFNTVLEQSKEDKQLPLWQLETIEDEAMLHMAYTFQRDIHNLYLKRRIVVSVIDTECRVGIVTRYIRPLCPPQELLDTFPENPEATFNLIARFVSLIPYLPDNLGVSDSCNIWLTSQQFLNLILGGKEDHAILLCNYFLYMKLNAFVLLGTSILDGATAYVITQEKMNTMIWNPETGECYDQNDAFCSVQSADCLINNENLLKPEVVAGVSEKKKVKRPKAKFQFDKTAKPLPVLSSQGANLHCSQQESVQLVTWRMHREIVTLIIWVNIQMHSLPMSLSFDVTKEYNWRPFFIKSSQHHVLSSVQVSGFPIQMRYSNLETIFDKVYSTGIHKIEIPNVEFAVAVYIYPYPNNVLSVWIYVASLECWPVGMEAEAHEEELDQTQLYYRSGGVLEDVWLQEWTVIGLVSDKTDDNLYFVDTGD